mmetsp:Transcript_26757/g.61945  ORF Transcript_26757/g.61945 Transcript_26757/m.61945 type:complete len:220 (+) Transcript_26757:1842-2501(+)
MPRGQPGQDCAARRHHPHHGSDGEARQPPAVPSVLLLGPQEPRPERGKQEEDRKRQGPPADCRGAPQLSRARWHRGGGVRVHQEARLGQPGEPEQNRDRGRDRGHHPGHGDARVKGQCAAAVRAGARGPCVEQRGKPGEGGEGGGDPPNHRGDARAPHALGHPGGPRPRQPGVSVRPEQEDSGAGGRHPSHPQEHEDQPPVPRRPGVWVLGAQAPCPRC